MEPEYPIIWKKEPCFRGECKMERTKHWWSIPFSASFGLACECYHCGKIRKVEIEI